MKENNVDANTILSLVRSIDKQLDMNKIEKPNLDTRLPKELSRRKIVDVNTLKQMYEDCVGYISDIEKGRTDSFLDGELYSCFDKCCYLCVLVYNLVELLPSFDFKYKYSIDEMLSYEVNVIEPTEKLIKNISSKMFEYQEIITKSSGDIKVEIHEEFEYAKRIYKALLDYHEYLNNVYLLIEKIFRTVPYLFIADEAEDKMYWWKITNENFIGDVFWMLLEAEKKTSINVRYDDDEGFCDIIEKGAWNSTLDRDIEALKINNLIELSQKN